MTTPLKDLSGTVSVPAIKIFTLAIKYLKDHAMGILNNPKCPELHLKQDEVFFVLTVPAIWDDRAKLFMKEAAVEVYIRVYNAFPESSLSF